MYEQCRFGRHIPFTREVLRDGLLRVPTRYPATNPGECDNFLNQVERHIGDNKSLITRLKVRNYYLYLFLREVRMLAKWKKESVIAKQRDSIIYQFCK